MIAAVLLFAAAALPDCSLAPGWKQQGAARSFAAENLFEYMDGNAEGYLIYGFVRMHGVSCTRGEDTFVLDISEMADADSAYGIFTANRDPAKPLEKIGMAAQIVPRRAVLVKGNYYVEIAANPDKDFSTELRAFTTAIEKRLPGRTTLPDALSWLPAEKLESVRLVPESVLGLRLLKRGYMAQYGYGKAFLVKEASPEAAAAIMDKLRARFSETTPVKLGDDGFRRDDKYLGRLAFFRKGQYLAGYANVAEGQDPVALAQALLNRLP